MSSNWWSQRLNGQVPSAPAPLPPMAPPQPVYNPVPQQPVPQEAPRLPQSAMTASRCPGCGSGNYGSVTPEAKARCYDCGYPIQQSGSGVGTGITQPGGSGPAQPARQLNTSNNFNPGTIIGRIE
jgi:hypothetical protein